MKKKKIVVLIMCVIAAVLISGGLFYFNKNYTWAFAVYQKGQSTAASVPSTADSLPLPQPSMPDSERYAPFAKDRVAEITKTDNWQAEVNVDNFQCYIELNYNFDKSVNYNDYTLSYEITKYLNNGKQQVTYGNGEFSQKDKKIGVGIILPSYKHRDRSWLEPATYAVQIFFTPTNDNSSLSPITCGTYIFAVNERGFVSGNQKNSEVVYMKNIFEKVLAEFRQHKIIDSVIIVLMAAMVTMIVMIVNVRNSAAATMAERSAPTISSSTTTENESIAVSSAASSSETSSAAVSSSSAPAVSQVSNSVSSSSVAVVANPAKTSSSAPKTSSAAAKPTITSGSPAPSKPTTSSAAVNNPLYAPIPIQSPQEIKTLNIAGGKLTLNLNAFAVCGYVSSKDVSQYMCDDAYFSVTENETGKVMVQGYTDEINDSNVVDISSGLDSYMHGSRAWLTSATYTVHVWCQKGQYSMNTTAGRPDKVDVCTFSFTVYERGFK